MRWPWKRFERFYEAHMQRQQVEELTQRKLMMIQAYYSNSNWDGEENSRKRQEAISTLEEQFKDVVTRIYNGKTEADDALKNNPFFSAVDRGLAKQGVPELDQFVPKED